MSKLSTVRAKLDNKLFDTNVLGSNITINKYSEGTANYGGYSSQSSSYGSNVSAIGVPYNLISKKLGYRPFGDNVEGDMDIVLRYDTDIDEKDKITYNTNEFEVNEVKDIPLNNGKAAIICRVSKL